MKDDSISALKVLINTMVWENAPGDMTLKRADEIAIAMFNAYADGVEEHERSKPQMG